MANNTKPLVGVSRCLLGDAVRYDAASKPSQLIIDDLSNQLELMPVCPEVEAGLGIPRPPVQLTGDPDKPRMTGRDDPQLDVTEALIAFCETRLPQLDRLAGFICKSRSPSCGKGSTPHFQAGIQVTDSADGVFIRQLQLRYPDLPIIDELELENEQLRNRFLQAVNTPD